MVEAQAQREPKVEDKENKDSSFLTRVATWITEHLQIIVFFGLAAFTAFWLYVLHVTLDTMLPCPEAANVSWWKYHIKYFSCRHPNEFGEFLAGAFAPLAFFWLVGVVVIQSGELRTQIKEFRNTQELIRAQAEFIGKQTEIMEAQRLADLKERNAEIWRQAYKKYLVAVGGVWLRFKYADDMGPDYSPKFVARVEFNARLENLEEFLEDLENLVNGPRKLVIHLDAAWEQAMLELHKLSLVIDDILDGADMPQLRQLLPISDAIDVGEFDYQERTRLIGMIDNLADQIRK